MTGDTDDENPNERDEMAQWAFIFNTLGEDTVRGMLLDLSQTFAQETDDTRSRRVIELRDDSVLDITDHVDALEEDLDAAPGHRDHTEVL